MATKKEIVAKIDILQEIPKGWKVFRFKEVFDFIRTESFSRDVLTDEPTEKQIQNIHYGDIHSKFGSEVLDLKLEAELPYIKDEVLTKDKYMLLKNGDLVIADASEDYEGVGECVELKNIGKKKITGGLHTFVVRDKNGKTADGFRCYILRNPSVRLNLKRIATGSNVYGISKNNLGELKIILPPIEEQVKIANILSLWDKAIELSEKLSAKKQPKEMGFLQEQKRGLMQVLLTGKKRVKLK